MNKDLVMLDYSFLFEPGAPWTNLYQFEDELGKFFSARGFQGQIVETMKGQGSRRVLLIKRVDPLLKGQQTPTQKPQTMSKSPPDALKMRDYKNPTIRNKKGTK